MAETRGRILPRALLALPLLMLLHVVGAQHPEIPTDDEMGPAAFMWPPDRVWSGDMDNQPPCGSRASPGNRTEFPLIGGAVALVAQDDYYNIRIGISYNNDPTSNDDFEILLDDESIDDLDPGHTCVSIPDPPSRIVAGSNATLQVIYIADWDAPHNQSFYACADITYVNAADFQTRIPCFNATQPGEDDTEASETPTPDDPEEEDDDEAQSGGLSGGAIAGVVIGTLGGVSVVIAAALLLYRRRQQAKRNKRLARMEENARMGGHWRSGADDPTAKGLKLQNLS